MYCELEFTELNSLLCQDNTRMHTSPSFSSLQYQDAGNYICETTLREIEGLQKRKTLKLVVEGNRADSYDY